MNELNKDLNSKDLNPLVSIIVITYNSSKYVLETLESAKAQTYKNIELIISDDCSTDDTVKVYTLNYYRKRIRLSANDIRVLTEDMEFS